MYNFVKQTGWWDNVQLCTTNYMLGQCTSLYSKLDGGTTYSFVQQTARWDNVPLFTANYMVRQHTNLYNKFIVTCDTSFI